MFVHGTNQTGINLNDDLEKVSNWAFQWKMSFNPDINKQVQEGILSPRLQKSNHPSITFNGTSVIQYEIRKKMCSIRNVLNKVSKTIGLLRKILQRPPLITIYKIFKRSHLDYKDVIYDQGYNVSFHQK